MGLLDHKELKIIKGVGKTPGDTVSLEASPTVINLLSKETGYTLLDWSPNIPSLKNGGLWADSNIQDGRRLLAGSNTNVIEKITVQLTASAHQGFAIQFATLQRAIQNARAAWTTLYQYEPVYLRWWADCAPGPQFALIYSIDLDVEYQDSANQQAQITLSIERDYAWTPVSPGMSPKAWTKYVRGLRFTASNAYVFDSSTGDDHLFSATLKNATERSAGKDSATAQNYIDIPAASIPGDLPARVCIWISGEPPSSNNNSIYVSRWTRFVTRESTVTTFTLPASDGNSLIADTAGQADTGGVQSARTRTTYATSAALVGRLRWSTTSAALYSLMYAGRFAVFLRCRLSAAGSVSLQIKAGFAGVSPLVGDVQTFTDVGSGGTGATTVWGFAYMGVFNPSLYNSKIPVNAEGTGIDNFESTSFEVWSARLSGTPELYISDLVLIPIDECAMQLNTPLTTIDSGVNVIFDNTGYMAHGAPGDFAISTFPSGTNFAAKGDTVEQRGTGITLLPQVNNRLYFLEVDNTLKRAKVQFNFDVGLNIIPCWSGIRDV